MGHFHPMQDKLIMIVSYSFLYSRYSSSLLLHLQIADQLLNNKALEFYKWDGDLSQLLQNVRDKLNKVAQVCFLKTLDYFGARLISIASLSLVVIINIPIVNPLLFLQEWTREEKNHCLEETEKSFKLSGEILRLILSW